MAKGEGKPEDLDIRMASKMIDPAIAMWWGLGNMVEVRRCILLQEYIHQTWLLEQKLESRAEYIEKECKAIGVVVRAMMERENDERDDTGRAGDSGTTV